MKTKQLLFIICTYLIFPGCGNNCDSYECELDTDSVPAMITEYHNYYNQNAESVTENEGVDFYIDVSYGTNWALRDENSKAFFKSFLTAQNFSKTEFFTLSGEKTNNLKFGGESESWNYFNNANTYTEKYAPIDEALLSIVKNEDNISILITDGELMLKVGSDHVESDLPWAKSAITNWLSLGNAIDCYVTDHIDEGKEKHLFYMVFVPKKLKEDRYLITLDNHLEKDKCASFHFSNSIFKVRTDYVSSKSGGVHEIMGLDEGSYIKKKDFEFLDFTTPWSEACDYLVNALDDNTGKEIKGGDYVLRSLFLEKNENPFYNIEKIDIIVEDIHEDLKNLYCYNSCIKTEPIMVVNENTSKRELDTENNECIVFDCRENNGEIKKDKTYSKADKFPKFPNYFVLNKELFENTLENGKAEIGIKLHKEMSDCYYEEKGEINLWKLSIVLKKCAPIDKAELKEYLQKFIWEGKKIETNDAMFQSFYGAILDASVNPENKTIYTYYIKSYN